MQVVWKRHVAHATEQPHFNKLYWAYGAHWTIRGPRMAEYAYDKPACHFVNEDGPLYEVTHYAEFEYPDPPEEDVDDESSDSTVSVGHEFDNDTG